jgi:ribosomal protein S18 acetylase RimI-like enzyme
LEPDFAFVLEDAQGVCGYVLGAPDSKRYYHAYLNTWLPEIRRRYAEPTGDPSGWDETQKVYYQYYHPDIYWPEPYAEYPSHVHIDLLSRAQGRGLGKEMMAVILRALTTAGSSGVHLGLAVSNQRAERFYRKLGFHELARVRDVLYLGKSLP